jgi:hypothetical protein
MSTAGHNSGYTLTLDEDIIKFLRTNSEVNVNMMMATLQNVHDGKLDLKKANMEKLVGYIEKFRIVMKKIDEVLPEDKR